MTVGRTASGSFQAGARRTLQCSARTVWDLVVSEQGQRALGARAALGPGSPGVTTLVDGSHYRRKVTVGRLQVRVLGASAGRSVLALHLEGLASARARTAALARFQVALDRLERLSSPARS